MTAPDRQTTPRTTPVRGVVLDVDGTLLDSNAGHAGAWARAARELGHEVTEARVLPLIGMGGDRLLPALLGIEKSSEAGRRLSERKDEIFRGEILSRLRPTPGARALLQRFRDDGLSLVVATSATRDDLQALLRQAGVHDLLDIGAATSASDVDESKPAPDVVEAAVRRSGLDASQLVMIGDTPYDVAASTRAGVRVIAVRCGGWSGDDLHGAVAVYDDPAALLRAYDASPFGDTAPAANPR